MASFPTPEVAEKASTGRNGLSARGSVHRISLILPALLLTEFHYPRPIITKISIRERSTDPVKPVWNAIHVNPSLFHVN